MSQEPQEPQADIGARLDEPAVVEFGADAPVRQRPRASQILTAVRKDWRLVPIVAGLSAVAIFASLVGEWQTTTFTPQSIVLPPEQVPPPGTAGVADLGGYATGYLIGIFVLVGCMSLLLFGRPAMRAQLRVLGLTAAGLSAAILAGATVWLDDHSASYQLSRLFFGPQGPTYELAYGRGLPMAFLGIAGFAIAFYLAGRLMPAPAVEPAAAGAGADAEPRDAATQVDWPWRRPRAAQEPDDLDSDLPPPADLTVGPTAPFVPMHDGKPPADGRNDLPTP
ncbi:hypothetical protein ACTMTJ_10520 [Phytohabitans sp. LJ34]|uniref:hypothetical protein n=1 Tax=Phytohabitans sp. LJ34 TaxID=3452217 RepID=UPI003F88BFDA